MFTYTPDTSLPLHTNLVLFCDWVLSPGPLGYGLRQPTYKYLINCNQVPAGMVGSTPVADISPWTTSCAMFVRACLHFAGHKPTPKAVNGQGIFSYLGLNYQSKCWVPYKVGNVPTPGSIFYVASTPTSNDGHVGIFLRETASGQAWETAEGGGTVVGAKPGTACKKGLRVLGNGKVPFDPYGRKLQGWWDLSLLELSKPTPIPTQLPKPTPVLVTLEEQKGLEGGEEVVSGVPGGGSSQTEEDASKGQPEAFKEVSPEEPKKEGVLQWWVIVVPVVTCVWVYLAALLRGCF